jgi:hypothetical protein
MPARSRIESLLHSQFGIGFCFLHRTAITLAALNWPEAAGYLMALPGRC